MEKLILEMFSVALMVNGIKIHGKKLLSSNYYDVSVNKYGVKCGASLKLWENKGWENKR